jgi:diguanylate cyclase (GGDEF)-like protein
MSSDETNQQRQLDELAEQNGLAVIVVDENSTELSESNNNSMCRILYNSEEFAPKCAEFCGKAHYWATETRKTVEYKCYAGLNCMAVQMKNRRSVAIVGRVFLKAEDYRRATERVVSGDWKKFPADDFFENALLSGTPENVTKLAREVQELELELPNPEYDGQILEVSALDVQKVEEQETPVTDDSENPKSKIANPKVSEWRSLFGSLLSLDYKDACFSIARFIEQRYEVSGVAWLERGENNLEIIFTDGALKDREIQLSIAADDERLLAALKREMPLELRERRRADDMTEPQTIWLFPVAVGGEIQSALVVVDEFKEESTKRQIAGFCRSIASQLEILRLRERLSQRSLVERAVKKFNESLKTIDSEDFWLHLINASAELMCAERSSLLVFDEKSDAFTAKAATGIKADYIKSESENLGLRVAKNVLNANKAVVIADVNKIGLPSAPKDWLYKSNSFISYPISIGTRKIGVLNLTDKADGNSYDAADIKLLDAVMPSLAVMIDRADLKLQAGEFRQLSVTDALTGLLNRRYLEERLTEEIKRSNRHGFPMSFLMIDVDEFKSYNDSFGHTEGDKALQIVGICLKETLRGADVAARYGGEEFSILLPQTTSAEAEVLAERVRERVAMTDFPNRQVTVSIGIASCSLSLNSPKDLISAADKALYEAKRLGRNNVQIYENLTR